MDTSKKYILMCEKAGEIQGLFFKQKKYSLCGDVLFCLNKDNSFFDSEWEERYQVIQKGYDEHIPKYYQKGYIWLPRQDQLQEMVIEKYVIWATLQLAFTKYLCKDCNLREPIKSDVFKVKMLANYSMEQLWLAFVMKEKYGKVWDGKEWVIK